MARCGCSNPGVLGCLCTLVDSNCVDVSGAGTVASPYTLAPIIDPAAGNIVSCGASGLAALSSDVRPNARASRTNSIADSVETSFIFDSEEYDPFGMHDNAVNNTRFTAVAAAGAGIYLAHVQASIGGGTSTGIFTAIIRHQGANKRGQRAQPSEVATALSVMVPVRLALNEYIELRVFQSFGGNRDVTAKLTISKLGGF